MVQIREKTIVTVLLLLVAVATSHAQSADIISGDMQRTVVPVSEDSDDSPCGVSPVCHHPSVAIKTNMLYDAFLIPDIGVEVALGRQWTVAADWFYTWFSSDHHRRYWQGYGGYLTVRHYFPSPATGKCPSRTFTGHHLGLYALGLTYDVEWGGRGYQAARFGFGAGVEYGYAMPIGRRLNLDFSLGLGFQDGEYKEYDPIDDHYVWQSTRKRHWWGPTKAEVSLVWLIGKGGCR